ncbi:MAG TPA: glycosyltransferase family 2 protein [Ruminococcus sp.]|nr:glycosyltransferase family 2 protein [Ruminococcus sp.]
MNNVEITVFTPSYNRAATLPRAFECLKRQTYKNFEWIIIDDGSSDNTQEVVEGFKKENPFFDIIYIYQENQGKHIATNNAVKICRGKFFITLDSDDACTDDALEVFLREWNKIPKEEQNKYYGVSCRTCDKNGKINGTKMDVPYIDSNDLDLRFKYKITGELWGMIRTDIMREFPFPVVEGYHFYPENVIWHNVGRKYMSRYLNVALRYYIQDQENAVTNVDRKKASKEKFVMHLHYINDCWDYRKYCRKRYVEHLVAITRDGLANGYKFGQILGMVKTGPRKFFVLTLSPLGFILYKRS